MVMRLLVAVMLVSLSRAVLAGRKILFVSFYRPEEQSLTPMEVSPCYRNGLTVVTEASSFC